MTTYTWNAINGEWGTALDWDAAADPTRHAAPTQEDDATINNGGAVDVASGENDAIARMLSVDKGALTVNGRLKVAEMYVGSLGYLSVDGGILNIGQETRAGGLFGLFGNVLVENSGVLNVASRHGGDVWGETTLATGGEYVFDDQLAHATFANIVDFTGTGGTFFDKAAWDGSIANFNTSDSNALKFGSAVTSFVFDASADVLRVQTLSNGAYRLHFLANGQALSRANFVLGVAADTIDYTGATVCFASGTRIRTARGDVAVEALQVGDLALTASGESRPIRWLGHRRLDCLRHPRRHEVLPVRIAAGAFGANKPARDLVVSPGHAICVDVVGEALIPAYALVNGASIQQLDVDEVTYWHVELDSHDVLLAENLAAESYFDAGNRAFFSENEVVRLDLTPEAADRVHANFRHPFHEAGALVEAVRAQLLLQARGLGWRLQHDPFADLRLMVDGRRIDPILEDRRARFPIPEGAQEIWLASATTRPLDVGAGADPRTLGVCLAGLSLEAEGDSREIALDDPALGAGFHTVERDGERMWRWTTGDARLPATLLGGAPCLLTVNLGGDAPPRWTAPACARGEADIAA